MRPSWLAGPVATATPVPVPLATKVPENAIDTRSPSGASAAAGAIHLSTGHQLSGQRRFVDAQVTRPGEAQIRRHAVARLEQYEVARDDVLRRNDHAPSVAHDGSTRVDHSPYGVERPFGAAFLDIADDGVEQHHGEHHRGIDDAR